MSTLEEYLQEAKILEKELKEYSRNYRETKKKLKMLLQKEKETLLIITKQEFYTQKAKDDLEIMFGCYVSLGIFGCYFIPTLFGCSLGFSDSEEEFRELCELQILIKRNMSVEMGREWEQIQKMIVP